MTQLGELSDKILRVLSDPGGAQFSTEIVGDGIEAALGAVLSWYAKAGLVVYEGDDVLNSFLLPEDYYQIHSVFDSESGLYLPSATMSSLQSPGQNIAASQDWIEYPSGSVSLARPIRSSEGITVYYAARWVVPALPTDELETPAWMDRALVFYAASYALLEKMTADALLSRWDVKQVDSGTPITNPAKEASTYFLERFRIDMERAPKGHSKRG